MNYPTDKDAMREFYPGVGVWKQELFITVPGYDLHLLCRARAVKGGTLIFIPGVDLVDKVE